MSKNKGKTLSEIYNRFKSDNETLLFQFIRIGGTGATDTKSAKVSIQIPIDICNNKNRNLGELNKYLGIVMFVPKEKAEKFMRGEID